MTGEDPNAIISKTIFICNLNGCANYERKGFQRILQWTSTANDPTNSCGVDGVDGIRTAH